MRNVGRISHPGSSGEKGGSGGMGSGLVEVRDVKYRSMANRMGRNSPISSLEQSVVE